MIIIKIYNVIDEYHVPLEALAHSFFSQVLTVACLRLFSLP